MVLGSYRVWLVARRFNKVWEVLDKEGKGKFGKACVQACKQICPEMEVLLPEMTVENFTDEPDHLSNMFWYYYTNDGLERDQALVSDLVDSGLLQMPAEQACQIRQMSILTCLSRSIDVYEAVWSKGTKPSAAPAEIDPMALKGVLQEQTNSINNNTCMKCKKANSSSLCARCKNVKYCSRECQTSHWKAHKPFCKASGTGDASDPKDELKKKLALAKKKAAERGDKRGPKISAR